MKKITSKELISFRVDGDTLLEIGPEGCLASDASAAFAQERLGANITVEDTTIEDAVADANAQLAPASDKLSRPKLEALALSEGITQADIDAAKSKTDLADLINVRRTNGAATVEDTTIEDANKSGADTTAAADTQTT